MSQKRGYSGPALLALLLASGWTQPSAAASLTSPGTPSATVRLDSGTAGGIDFRLPASEHLLIDRGTAVRFGLMFPVPSGGQSSSDEEELQLRPTSSASIGDSDNVVLEVAPAGLAANSRAGAFVPWLDTLYIAIGSSHGFAGSYGAHRRWSNEIDQWIAELNNFRPR